MCETQIHSTNTQKNDTNTQKSSKIYARIVPKNQKRTQNAAPITPIMHAKNSALSQIGAKTMQKPGQAQGKIAKTSLNNPKKPIYKRKMAICVYFSYKKAKHPGKQFKTKTPNL